MTRTGVDALLANEIERRLSILEDASPRLDDVRAVFHALRGSSGMAGHGDLSLLIGNFSARLRAGDTSVIEVAARVSRRAAERLRAGLPPLAERWPKPPEGLGATVIDPRHRGEYTAGLLERLSSLDALLESETPDVDGLFRTVHAIKGAAAAVGDEATAWYCHGLEARLKPDAAEGPLELEEVAKHRAVLGLLLEDPAAALETLSAESSAGSSRAPPLRPSQRPQAPDGGHVRISASAIDELVERVEHVALIQDQLAERAREAGRAAQWLREQRASLVEALRQIGPPRPWGAPASALSRVERSTRVLGELASGGERARRVLDDGSEELRRRVREMHNQLAALRRASVRDLLERVARATERFAAHNERLVRVQVEAPELGMDRDVAERLFDPLLQLAKNAVVHGIEGASERAERGKPPIGTVTLKATAIGDWVRLDVEDDGRGIDVDAVRQLAVERHAMTPEAARSAPEDALLALLFTPGLTTQPSADVLAGRGIGLDLSQQFVARLGGTLRVSTRHGSGVTATIDIPGERAVVDVVWLSTADTWFALPLRFSGEVTQSAPDSGVRSLASYVGLESRGTPSLAIELVVHGASRVAVGVDRIGKVEEAALRPLPALLAGTGPWGGAILFRGGALRLVLDAPSIAARALANSA